MRNVLLTLTTCLLVSPVIAKYSGGTGDPNDPYQIATAADLIALGETPDDYDKHFILTADIDLDPILPGGRVFDKAVIAPHTDPTFCDRSGHCVYDDTAFFTGVFDGNGHTIWHLTIVGDSDLGLFEQLSGEVKDLGLADVNIAGSGSYIGGLAGAGSGTNCRVSGNVSGRIYVGGLAGAGGGTNCHSTATVSGDVYIGGLLGSGVALHCYSTGSVSGDSYVGGLIGESGWIVSQCYSTGTVHGNKYVGGLVGHNLWSPNVGEVGPAEIANCYSTANVDGNDCIGGLVGQNYYGPVTNCYAAGVVSGAGSVGGLVGHGDLGTVTACFWDIDTSGQATSDGGTGMITAEMQTGARFLIWGMCDNEGIWTIDEGKDYPRLSWENRRGEPIRMPELADLLLGSGTENDPFLIYTHEELNAVGLYPCEWDKHFRLMADIDLDPALPGRKIFDGAVIASDTDPGNSAFREIPFTGLFDGSGHTISHLTIIGGGYLGLFGRLGPGAELTDLGVVDVNITGSGDYVGGLVGHSAGLITRCYSTGTASGHYYDTYAYVGGLVGFNRGSIATSYSTVSAGGGGAVGGLVGGNRNDVRNCHSTGAAIGKREVGGLVGSNYGSVTASYSTATVSGGWAVGGLVGWSDRGNVAACFWDIEISGFPWGYTAGVTGKTTAEMQTASTFLDAGWDFVDETTNGADDIWWILEGQDYPRLWWELIAEK